MYQSRLTRTAISRGIRFREKKTTGHITWGLITQLPPVPADFTPGKFSGIFMAGAKRINLGTDDGGSIVRTRLCFWLHTTLLWTFYESGKGTAMLKPSYIIAGSYMNSSSCKVQHNKKVSWTDWRQRSLSWKGALISIWLDYWMDLKIYSPRF